MAFLWRPDASDVKGTTIPIPPQQSARWVAPETALPPNLLSACYDLFDAGMSDPRGCEYREIVVKLERQSEERNAVESLTTHGWVLPAQPNEPVRYAVCWDGLTYPLVSVGAPIDLDADIGKLLGENSTASSHDPTRPSQTESLSYDELTLVKVPLLLRLNKIHPAEKLWQRWSTLAQFSITNGNREEWEHFDPFTVLFREWLWAQFNRAVQAHLCGDSKLALAYVQPLPDLRSRVEQMAMRRGVPLAKVSAFFRSPDRSLDLMFLNQVPVLLEDEQRRVKENVMNRDEEYNPDAITDKPQRIALLIRDLEDVEAYPFMSPGYIGFGTNAVVEALVKQGDDAVDPLLDCLEHDHRLTRTLDDGGSRHFQAYGYSRIVGVEEPAFDALQAILKAQDQFSWPDEPYVNGSPGGPKLKREVLAAQIRAYWNKVRGQPLPQRWYGVLLDDQATPEAWAEAAGDIVLPDDADLFSGFGILMRMHTPGTPIHLWGENLRSKINPSVSELLVKRLKQSLAKQDPKSPFPLEASKKLATALARWDGENQIETLRWYCDALQKIILTQTENNGTSEIDELIKTYLERVEARDPQALGDYAQWIRAADAKKLSKLTQGYGATFFSPVWSYPNDPAMVALTKWLFEDSHSPWSLGTSDVDPGWIANSTHLPLVAVPAFRALLLQQLKNKKVIGNVDTPPAGTKKDLRLCDFIADKISAIRGAPRCEPYWTVAQRDRALRETALFLQRYGDRFAHQTTSQENQYDFNEILLHFPTLDHPATRDDVAAGRAIFSLEGKGRRKIWPLPEIPMRAKWITLKDSPTVGHGYDSLTKQATTVKDFDQDGTIWQAEDVLIHGAWHRYYGFVGKNCLATVPGDEIQFDGGDFNDSVDGWGFVIDSQKKEDSQSLRRRLTGKLGDPISIMVWTENLRGIERAFPKSTHGPGPVSAEDLGLEISLTYTSRPLNALFTFPPAPESKWEPVAAKAPVQIELMPVPATLAPMEKSLLLQCDLSKFYEFKSPGTFRVVLKFRKGGLLDSEWSPSPQDIELTK